MLLVYACVLDILNTILVIIMCIYDTFLYMHVHQVTKEKLEFL